MLKLHLNKGWRTLAQRYCHLTRVSFDVGSRLELIVLKSDTVLLKRACFVHQELFRVHRAELVRSVDTLGSQCPGIGVRAQLIREELLV